MKTLAWIALLGVAACTPPAPPAAPPPPPAPLAAPSSPKRSAGLQVVFDLKKTPIPVSFGEAFLDLQPMAGRTFVTLQDVLFYIDGDTLRSDPALQRGLSDEPKHAYLAVSLGAMGGHWPDAAWVQVAFRGERFFSSTFLRWGGDQWVAAHTDGTGVATAVVPLANAWSLVILRSPWSYVSTPGSPTSLLHPRLGVPVRQLDPADSAATLPDGSLFTAVDGHVRLWGPDGSPKPLPSPSYGTTHRAPVTSELVALSPSAVYLLNVSNEERPDRRLLRFDGQRWFVEPTPGPGPDRIFAGPRGALWVGMGDALFERASDGTWSELSVPARLDKVWVSPTDDVWATSGGTLLLHTRPLPDGVDLAAMVPPGEPVRWSPECPSMTALLDELPRTAPQDFDFHAQLDAVTPALGKLAPYFAFWDLMIAGKRRLAVRLPEHGGLDAKLVQSAADEVVAQATKRGAPRPRRVCVDLTAGVDGARLVRAGAPVPPPPPEPPPAPAPRGGCSTPLVVLFAPGKGVPADFDFPLTRKALKGHVELGQVRFWDFRRQGKRVIAASTRSPKEAAALIALVRRHVAGSAPGLVCESAPAGAREIKVDLATGNVVK